VSFANDVWTVVIYDMAQAVGEKRGAQVALIFDKLLPKGYSRETFAGKKAQRLDAARIAKLTKFLEDGEGDRSARRIARPDPGRQGRVLRRRRRARARRGTKVDGDTLYMIASNTKGSRRCCSRSWSTPARSPGRRR
jgi:hypothetical protein